MRPIRFGCYSAGAATDRATLVETARLAEQSGFATFGMGDHFPVPMAPLVALQAAADATTTIRLTMGILCNDFRHPAVLAKEAATLDVLSGGRLELGIGAGYMEQYDYVQPGITFDKASVRIERLEESVQIVKGLFAGGPFSFSGKYYNVQELAGSPTPVQRPGPPILVGGGGPKVLSVGARHADIIGLVPGLRGGRVMLNAEGLSPKTFQERVSGIRDAAGDRFDEIEINTWVFGFEVTTDQRKGVQNALAALVGGQGGSLGMSDEEILASPNFMIGTVDQICEKLLDTRERYGINYFSLPPAMNPETIIPVVEALDGA